MYVPEQRCLCVRQFDLRATMKRLILFLFALLWATSAWAALARDGTPVQGHIAGAAASTVASAAFTNTNTTAVVLAFVGIADGTNTRTVSSLACGSLTLALVTGSRIQGVTSSFNHGDLEVWYAVESGTALTSQTCTATLSGTATSADILIIAFSGENTTTPFDTNGSLPVTASNLSGVASAPSVTISTTNANTVLLTAGQVPGAAWNSGSAPTYPTGFTGYFVSGFTGSPNFYNNDMAVAYEIVSSAQSSTAVAFGTTSINWLDTGDAVRIAGAAATLCTRSMMGVGC